MRYLLLTAVLVFCFMSGFSEGAGKRISESGNKHNFSYTNLSANYRAVPGGDVYGYDRGAQICVFCHTPHRSSVEGPLWNRIGTTKSFFKHYSSPTLAIDDPAFKAISEYGQPNGSTRLCLSCHDGVTALGAVFTTPGTIVSVPIQFNKATIGHETYSTHHPVSFNYNPSVRSILNTTYGRTYWYNPPSPNEVKLDKQQRMQCTTCHDPHQDRSDVPSSMTPFWTSKTYSEVCQSCHNIVPAYPW